MYSIETGITTSLPFTFLRDKSVQETKLLKVFLYFVEKKKTKYYFQ